MTKPHEISQPIEFSQRLLQEIDKLPEQDWSRRSYFLYSTLNRERVRGLRTSQSALCIILQGTKEIWQHGVQEEFGPGALIALSEGEEIDVVNVPKDARSPFISLSLLIDVNDTPNVALSTPMPDPSSKFRVSQSVHLMSAILSTCVDLGELSGNAEISDLRRRELVLLLTADPIACCLFDQSTAQSLRKLIHNTPDREWTVDLASTELGMGASTLRRKLTFEGASFSDVLREQRLLVAYPDGATVLEAQTVSGFRSRSHFARHFHERFGKNPSRL